VINFVHPRLRGQVQSSSQNAAIPKIRAICSEFQRHWRVSIGTVLAVNNAVGLAVLIWFAGNWLAI
jgi:hypothetical protein